MALGGSQKGGGAAVKGLRLLTMTRGPDGFGFHMYTNKERDGQYIKNVAINSPSDLAGMLPGDHVLYVDNHNVSGESHHQVHIYIYIYIIYASVQTLGNFNLNRH